MLYSCSESNMAIKEKRYNIYSDITEIELGSRIDISIEPAINNDTYVVVIANDYIVHKVGVKVDDSGLLKVWLDDGQIEGDTFILVKIFAKGVSRVEMGKGSVNTINSLSLSSKKLHLDLSDESKLKIVGIKYDVDTLNIDVKTSSSCQFINTIEINKILNINCNKNSDVSVKYLLNHSKSLFDIQNSSKCIISGVDDNSDHQQKVYVGSNSLYNAKDYSVPQLIFSIRENSSASIYVNNNLSADIYNKSVVECFIDRNTFVAEHIYVSNDSELYYKDYSLVP